jgi:hypothetical protein
MNPRQEKSPQTEPQPSDRAPGFVDIVLSVLAGFFGVQSERNRARDFQHGRPIHYILVGLALTLLFILAVLLAVKWVLRSAGV